MNQNGMRLTNPDGHSFSLSILGYQFPELATADYDSNWLRVAIEVSHPRGNWKASDPALLTYEVERLAKWLESVSRGAPTEPEEAFMEPNLLFRVLEGPAGTILRILFGLELRPKWAESDVASTGGVFVDFPLGDLDLSAAASDLRDQLRRFPQRTAV